MCKRRGVRADAAQGVLRGRMKCLATTMEASWSVIATEGDRLTLTTNFRAPRNRIVALDAAAAATGALTSGTFSEVLPQHPRDLMQVRPRLRPCRCTASCRSAAAHVPAALRSCHGVPRAVGRHRCTVVARHAYSALWIHTVAVQGPGTHTEPCG
jgi:hypothetical protein